MRACRAETLANLGAERTCLVSRGSTVGVAMMCEQAKETSIGVRPFIFRLASSVTLCAFVFGFWSSEISRAQMPDSGKADYARAVEYCRGDVKRPMMLDPDKRILCLDGPISAGQDVSLAKGLGEKGLFVVRSPGGDVPATIALADLLQDRRATVVVYDYCLLTCASYLLFASAETFVLKNTLVAWRYSDESPWCPSLVTPKDDGPKRLEVAPCTGAPPEYQSGYTEFRNLSRRFYAARTVDPLIEWPPESFAIRRMLKSMFDGTGRFPDVFWTWNPKHYANAIKTKVVYEAYPKSQSEVDAMASELGLSRVLHDP